MPKRVIFFAQINCYAAKQFSKIRSGTKLKQHCVLETSPDSESSTAASNSILPKVSNPESGHENSDIGGFTKPQIHGARDSILTTYIPSYAAYVLHMDYYSI